MTPNATMKTRRAELGMTQADVARLAGCTKQFVSLVESGQSKPSVAQAGKLARALGSRLVDLWPDQYGS